MQRVVHAAGSAVLAACLLVGCSKPAPVAADDEWSLDPGNTLRADVKAGGVEATYTAHFDGPHVQRISEVRKSGAGNAAKGEYEFHGARLTHYTGAALLGAQQIELTFDLQGALVSSSGASEAEMAAVRDRASLLRSLALTRRSTQSHGG
ncbi:hypothetical protein [Povalibacter sp.]|uniref:hypothetical protein n=1 Tax=Povalibacter sp. TaxID=1962978 RepID=UPI002F426F35